MSGRYNSIEDQERCFNLVEQDGMRETHSRIQERGRLAPRYAFHEDEDLRARRQGHHPLEPLERIDRDGYPLRERELDGLNLAALRRHRYHHFNLSLEDAVDDGTLFNNGPNDSFRLRGIRDHRGSSDRPNMRAPRFNDGLVDEVGLGRRNPDLRGGLREERDISQGYFAEPCECMRRDISRGYFTEPWDRMRRGMERHHDRFHEITSEIRRPRRVFEGERLHDGATYRPQIRVQDVLQCELLNDGMEDLRTGRRGLRPGEVDPLDTIQKRRNELDEEESELERRRGCCPHELEEHFRCRFEGNLEDALEHVFADDFGREDYAYERPGRGLEGTRGHVSRATRFPPPCEHPPEYDHFDGDFRAVHRGRCAHPFPNREDGFRPLQREDGRPNVVGNRNTTRGPNPPAGPVHDLVTPQRLTSGIQAKAAATNPSPATPSLAADPAENAVRERPQGQFPTQGTIDETKKLKDHARISLKERKKVANAPRPGARDTSVDIGHISRAEIGRNNDSESSDSGADTPDGSSDDSDGEDLLEPMAKTLSIV
ncbi:MAG: hypothetical protein ALECFALPRED_001836 [Alectoria fallacina]|uniref:Uncharacterized protein n=1 Tax=Alectoria fallacina TaxID=1903189 RepID=A0A8H3FGN8_9LECA|nr:MAG: hypothetical protein ALECFALPRED_001836 [Alectoria fallacina]